MRNPLLREMKMGTRQWCKGFIERTNKMCFPKTADYC
jgi:hypothetical protein